MELATTPRAGPAASGSAGRRPSRRWRGPGLAGLAIVAMAALIITLNLTAKYLVTEPPAKTLAIFGHYLGAHLFIGGMVLLAAAWVRRRFPANGFAQYAAAAAAVVLATAVALLVLMLPWDGLTLAELRQFFDEALAVFLSDLFRYSFVGLAITSAWLYLSAEADHQAAAKQCAIDAERMDRQTAEARLQVLEAQIEPHFLFNTLAHVRRLYETDPAAGARMLRNLADYLAGALPQMRAASTLGRELDHVRAYLDIQRIRMGRRLDCAIDVTAALRDAELPPLMVLTLVENAIKHGLSPLPEGGRIDVRAAISADGRLCVQVADTGQGFAKASGGGTGLANTRARLASKYGLRASLSLALNTPRGVIATLALPLEIGTRVRAEP
jgi:sensor histidine kinase YesM